ncbi:hypothetical protein HYR69_06045 [Candidatus Sumerlaeota bacterium]|nr:hypothetical protein [Candidatus Sumerlaeota bacterium]
MWRRGDLMLFGLVVVAFLFLSGTFSSNEAGFLGRRIYYGARNAIAGIFSPPPPGSYTEASQCRENLREIERAKRRAAELKSMTTGMLSVQEVEAALGRPLPQCPSGGTYFINPLVQLPTCSIGSQDSLDRRDDHVITKF